MSQIVPQALPERDRYVLDDAGKHIGAAHYRDYQGENGVERIFFHTVVDEEYSGQGLASKLAAFALDDTVSAGMKIVPVCPYIKKYVGKHQEFEPDVVPPRPHHLQILPKA
ncbi:GNAT family N-acetyltransferase [Glutamicibacter creatinolyticus]|uniref:GNAT family N-acetyltransferase n=1 Tax=Glutamicibacter creatinolyticus TaxID=162496 RepID=A0A5B7WXI2_9MICC|nr:MULTISPECIES: GNAT family N-acetyltransferase [Micrococcaceae]QCY48632.1 GNAT family N-acetyltransferase [Glutamicibacter creatinolyticus]